MHNTMILILTQFDNHDHQQSPEQKYSISVPKGSFIIIDDNMVQEFIASINSQLLAMNKRISNYWYGLHFRLTISMSNHQLKIMTTQKISE